MTTTHVPSEATMGSARSPTAAGPPAVKITRPPLKLGQLNRVNPRRANRQSAFVPVPLLMQHGGDHVWVEAGRLPLADASVSAINCHDVVENVRDDEEAIDELARVLQPGGRLVLRVPSNGPLAWLDSYNLYHYLVDVSGHGPRAPETEEIGWRRHYDLDDIAMLLGRDRFRIVGVRTVGIGIAETVNIALLAICRFLFAAERFYQRSARFRAGVRRLEDRLPASAVGTTLIVTAERLDSPIP